VAGVAASLAQALGISPAATRLALVALCFAGGAGFAIYLAGWALLPPADGAPTIGQQAWGDRRTVSAVLAVASVLIALLVAASALGHDALLGAVSPGVVSLAALVAVWRHAGPGDREAVQRLAALFSSSPPGGPASPARWYYAAVAARLALGAGLVAVGASSLLAPQHITGADMRAALGALALVAGCALVLAPWWLRLGRELATERRERARAQERAEMAEHLHDSVLQTLALIQRASDDPHKVVSLARAQERHLRRWLFDKASPDEPGPGATAATLSEALAALQQDVEAAHDVQVELVTVGDAPLNPELRAVVAATREALVNAAKWSGADRVSVFSEVEPDHASVFVLDRGVGFDPDLVAADRKGISESITARVTRKGGTATVRSVVGEGTEVTLRVPRRPSHD
jgi:signal transduction histidine kinase